MLLYDAEKPEDHRSQAFSVDVGLCRSSAEIFSDFRSINSLQSGVDVLDCSLSQLLAVLTFSIHLCLINLSMFQTGVLSSPLLPTLCFAVRLKQRILSEWI